MSRVSVAPHDFDMAALAAQGAELIARDRWSRRQLLDFQRRRLRALLAEAVATSPYYRETLGPDPARGEVALHNLPTLSKATLVDQFDRIVTDPSLKLANLERHVQGPDPGALHLDRYRIFSTSGTSGLRALVVYSEEEFRFWVAVSHRLFARIGITPGTRLVAIGAPEPLHISRQLFAAFGAGRTVPSLSVLTPMEEIVDALNDYRPEALVGYASITAMLAQEQLEGRLRIAPRIVGVSAEVLTDEARRWIDQAWGVHPAQVYASTEVLYIAASTPPGPDLHIYEDLVIVEVVDEHNRPVPPGRPGYRVLLTNLVNRTQPLIRYELSDSVTLATPAVASDLPYQRVAAVDGRSDDILRLPGTNGREITIHPYRLRAPFASLADVRQYQIVYDGALLHVTIVTCASAARDVAARVRRALESIVQAAGAVAPAIEVTPVDSIAREPGHAAKLKLVVNLASGSTPG
jgi:putative adenylate-forming enzyme